MKKNITLSMLFVLSLFIKNSFAQLSPAQLDEAAALRAGRIQVECDRTLLGPNDIAALNLKVLIPPHGVNPSTMQADEAAATVDFPSSVDPVLPSGYSEAKWTILQGGGSLIKNIENRYSYIAPATAPADKIMIVQIELDPKAHGLAKVILLQTLYFEDDPTSIAVNFPLAGFNNEKYKNSPSKGFTPPTMQGMDPRAAARMTPDIQAKMAQAQQAVAAMQQSTGLNVAALTSNANILYDSATDISVFKIMQLQLSMTNGKPATGVAAFLCEFSFKGKPTVGIHQLDAKVAGVGFLQIGGKGCGCGNNQNGEKGEAPCKGYVNIKSMDDKGVMKGFIHAKMYGTSANYKFVSGFLSGNFTVNYAGANRISN